MPKRNACYNDSSIHHEKTIDIFQFDILSRCCGAGDAPWEIVERAIRYGCKRVQLFKPYFNREMIQKAHANGIICNVFWSDDPAEAKEFLDMGIDVILTNDFHRIAAVVGEKEKYVTY